MKTPQSLIEERREKLKRKWETGEIHWNGNLENEVSYERIQAFLKDSIQAGIALGLSLAKEAVPERRVSNPFLKGTRKALADVQVDVWNKCTNETLTRITALEGTT